MKVYAVWFRDYDWVDRDNHSDTLIHLYATKELAEEVCARLNKHADPHDGPRYDVEEEEVLERG